MWRALCKRGTGEIVCDNVKDKTGIIFLSISLLQKLLFTACFCLCASARRVCYVSLHVLRICWCGPFSWQTPSTLDLSTCSASARGAGLSLTLVQLSLTHTQLWGCVSFTSSPFWHLSMCVSRCRCVSELAGWLVCEVRLNGCLAMRGGNWGVTGRISHTHTHTSSDNRNNTIRATCKLQVRPMPRWLFHTLFRPCRLSPCVR